MRMHNLIKYLVLQKVEEMFSQKDEVEKLSLKNTPAEKMDVACYVLNRSQPQYVVSGRGVAYNETIDYKKKLQNLADITKLIREGMISVAKHNRDRGIDSFEKSPKGSFFNFPPIIGRLFNGLNFEPVHDISISLLYQGELVKAIDSNWQNPYKLVSNTAGTYIFWPYPIPAKQGGKEKEFEFELVISDDRFEPLNYVFEITSHPEHEFVDSVNTAQSFRIKDLYLFPCE